MRLAQRFVLPLPLPLPLQFALLALTLSAPFAAPATLCAQSGAAPRKAPAATRMASSDAISYVRVNGADYNFTTKDVIASGIVAFELVNNGPDLHALAVLELPDNRSLKEFLDLYHSKGIIPPWMAVLGQSPTIAATQSAFVTVRLKPGRYILACLIPARDGRAHSEKGMVKLITAK